MLETTRPVTTVHQYVKLFRYGSRSRRSKVRASSVLTVSNPMKRWLFPVLVLTAFAVVPRDAEAQLFGERNLGRSSLSRRMRPGSAEDAGTLTGNERFIRGNRSRRAFVGTDTQDVNGFVGSEQATATGNVTSTTTGLQPPPDRSDAINKPLPARSPTSMYYPRLEIRFDVPRPQSVRPTVISQRLEESEAFRQLGEIQVSVSGPTATLQGEVASESDRQLAALLASFEPGIDRVQNNLTVNTALKAPPLPPEPGPDAIAP